VKARHEFMSNLFNEEKQRAFRDIKALIDSAPIFMFIKGTLDAPKCKFTKKMVETLAPFKYRGIKTFNILEDERIRQWLKFFSSWPTFPQVFVASKFIGGVDILCELVEDGEFEALLPSECKPLPPVELFQEFITKNHIVAFLVSE
jgi:Grx4 family monothiol glutaredoxin